MSSNSLNSLVIAKTGSSSSFWLPLWMHHKDTGMVMEYLLEEFVSDSFEDTCGLTKGELKKLALFIAMVHDIGKATAGFQYKIGMKLPWAAAKQKRLCLLPNCLPINVEKKVCPACRKVFVLWIFRLRKDILLFL